MSKMLNENKRSKLTDWYRVGFGVFLLLVSAAFEIIRTYTPHLNGEADTLSLMAGLGLLIGGGLILVCFIILSYRLIRWNQVGRTSSNLCWILIALSTVLLLASAVMTCLMSVLTYHAY